MLWLFWWHFIIDLPFPPLHTHSKYLLLSQRYLNFWLNLSCGRNTVFLVSFTFTRMYAIIKHSLFSLNSLILFMITLKSRKKNFLTQTSKLYMKEVSIELVANSSGLCVYNWFKIFLNLKDITVITPNSKIQREDHVTSKTFLILFPSLFQTHTFSSLISIIIFT